MTALQDRCSGPRWPSKRTGPDVYNYHKLPKADPGWGRFPAPSLIVVVVTSLSVEDIANTQILYLSLLSPSLFCLRLYLYSI